jgi:hypothetical protein
MQMRFVALLSLAASTQITLAPCGSPTPDPDVVVPGFTG